MFRYIIILSLLINAFAFSQKNNTYQEIIKSNIELKRKIQKIDSLSTTLPIKLKKEVLSDFSVWLYYNGAIEDAIIYKKKTLALSKEITPKDHNDIQKQLMTLGGFYIKKESYTKSINISFSAIEIDNKSYYAARAYGMIGRSYKAIGNYHQAIEYFEQAEKIYLANNYIKDFIINTLNFTATYHKIGTLEYYNKAIKKLLFAEKKALKHNISNKRLFKLYVGIGNLYNEPLTYDHEKAFYYFKKAENYAVLTQNNNTIASANLSLGNLFVKSNFKTAINYFNKALKYSNKNNQINSRIYHNLGYCHLYKESSTYYTPRTDKDSINLAISYFNKGLNHALKNNDGEALDINFFKSINDSNKNVVYQYLKDLAVGYQSLFLIDHNKKDLKTSLKYFKQADIIYDLLVLESTEVQSKMHWRKKANRLYSKAMESAYFSEDLNDYFYFMEKNKALLLQQDLLYVQSKEKLNIPLPLRQQENSLKKSIYTLKKASDNDSIQLKLLTQKRALEKLQDSIKLLHPNYFKENEQLIISLTSAQKHLKNEEAILSYNIFKDISYGLYFDNSNCYKFKLENSHKIKELTHHFFTLTTQPFSSKENKQAFEKTSKALYQLLIPKEIRSMISTKEKLTIIPDNFLNNISFDALITPNGDFLIENHEVSYQFSNSFSRNIESKKSTDLNISVFAPEEFKEQQLPPLANSQAEIESINNNINALIFTKAEATKENFLIRLEKDHIIHLATHANAKDSITPWIAFNDQKINLEELYLTQNNANMIVLSACQTNNGSLAIGEGVISLSRAFFQTGSKSVVSSLWNVDDKATPKIISSFYENLKKGKTKSQALRLAKLNYIKNHSLSEASPYYWAPLVIIGNTNTINIQNSNWVYYLLFGGIILLLIGYILYKRRIKTT